MMEVNYNARETFSLFQFVTLFIYACTATVHIRNPQNMDDKMIYLTCRTTSKSMCLYA